jgi:hypothetical protein
VGVHRWTIDSTQLDLYRSWPTIAKFTRRGGGKPIPGFPQNFELKPRNRLFSAFLLAKKPGRPHSAPLNHAVEIVSADTIHAASADVGTKTFDGIGEIPFGYTFWNLILQLLGEELIVDGVQANPNAKTLVDAMLDFIRTPGASESRRPMIGFEIKVTSLAAPR